MFTIDLAEQQKAAGITANTLHPGTYLRTKMVTEAGISPLGEPKEGAEAIFYLASSPELESITGTYFNQQTAGRAQGQAYDAKAREALRKLSEEYISRSFSRH